MSQWDRLLLNLGVWDGTFARLAPSGQLQVDIPSVVSLEGLNQNRTMRQVIRKSEGGEIKEQVLEYSTLSRSLHFFETGAFSQGSLQLGPFSVFGTEIGFIHGDRRLRLVQLFDEQAQLSQLTLIQEQRRGIAGLAPQPPLTVDALIGTWQGEATTHYPDLRSPDHYTTTLQLDRQGDILTQSLALPHRTMTSQAHITESALQFGEGDDTVQVLLLLGGASSTTPLSLPKRQAFFLEAGWLISPTLRQRMIRRYGDSGALETLTLVVEHKQTGAC
ncbi:MAG: DUF3598 family protein [Elainellaceae cyanobacterium]